MAKMIRAGEQCPKSPKSEAADFTYYHQLTCPFGSQTLELSPGSHVPFIKCICDKYDCCELFQL